VYTSFKLNKKPLGVYTAAQVQHDAFYRTLKNRRITLSFNLNEVPVFVYLFFFAFREINWNIQMGQWRLIPNTMSEITRDWPKGGDVSLIHIIIIILIYSITITVTGYNDIIYYNYYNFFFWWPHSRRPVVVVTFPVIVMTTVIAPRPANQLETRRGRQSGYRRIIII